MANPKKNLIWVCVAYIWIINSCTVDARLNHEILHIEGVSWACNVSTSYALYGSMYEFEEQWEVRLPASDGDLLYMVNEENLELYYRYSSKDGNHLVVSQDTIKPELAFINGALNQIEITDETSFKKMISELSIPLEKQLSTLFIRDSLTEEMILELKQIETSLRGTGLVLEHNIGSKQFEDLLSICRPRWLTLEEIPVDPDAEQALFLEDLELLWINSDILAFSQNVQCCKNLESLIVADWIPGTGELMPLASLKQLHSLTLVECEIHDLSQIEFPGTLQRFHLVNCDTLTDISALAVVPELKSLGLAGSDDVESLESMTNFSKLLRISFPVNTSQEEFVAIVDQLKSLEVVELINCPGVHDISALQKQKELKILILQFDQTWPEHLGSLDQVDMIVLNSEIFEEDPERIAELRTQLPNTLIVPGSGICLGSGWILLLLPVLILSRLLFRKK